MLFNQADDRTDEAKSKVSSFLPRTAKVQRNSGPRICSLASDGCTIANCSVLLSPCIAQYAWVTDTLLGMHGIRDFVIDPSTWKQQIVSASTDQSDLELDRNEHSTGVPLFKDKCVRKICLVESRRKGATDAFIKKIEEVDLRRKSGKREWVGVYDWRVLEAITELEPRKRGLGDRDPWRKYYVGIA
jgi:DNA ligase 4